MKEGSVLVIVIGGNISQILDASESGDPKLIPASEDKITEFLIREHKNSSAIVLQEGNNPKGKAIRVQVKRLGAINNLEQQDSAQVKPKIWSDLVSLIKENEKDHEGFVVLHGLDTLSYTASAISFMISNLKMPIVFTGSQRPLNFVRSDAPQNIVTAITIAAAKSLSIKPINEVTIYLHDTLYRANRASMSSASSYRSFDSLNYPPLATIGEHIDIKEHLIAKAPTTGNTSYSLSADANVQIIDVFPGMSPRVIEGLVGDDLDLIYVDSLKQQVLSIADEEGVALEDTNDYKLLVEIEQSLAESKQPIRLCNLLPEHKREEARKSLMKLEEKSVKQDRKLRGVILRTYGMGTAPTSTDVLKALKRLVDSNVIVMNVTQAHSSKVSFNSDPVSLRLFEQGVISGLDMTSEAAFAKMVVTLSNDKNWEKGREHCEEELQKDISGEQSHTVKTFHFSTGEAMEDDNSSDGYISRLKFNTKGRDKDFILTDLELSNVENIQLRILGLRKKVRGARTVQIRIIRCDDNMQSVDTGVRIIELEEVLENPRETNGAKTINVSYDITAKKNQLFSKNAAFYIEADQNIEWSRISLVVYC